MTTSPVTTTEYWNAAPHPQLAHLPQLPHPLSANKVVTATVPATATKKLPTTQTTKIGMEFYKRNNLFENYSTIGIFVRFSSDCAII